MIKNNAKRLLKISFLSLFLLLPFINVSALSVSHTSVGYGYEYWDTNNTYHKVNWVSYSTDNLVKYNYDLPETYDDEGISILDFGFRFHIDGNFKANTNYAITFTWSNYDSSNSVFLMHFSHLLQTYHCRVSSWTSTSQDESYCYNSTNITYSKGSRDSDVIVTWYFTPKIDFYGGVIYNYHDNDPYVAFGSDGWEITNISYTTTTDSSQDIINNANQNANNIINNQNSNTNSIINNQNQNTQNIIDNQNANTQAQIDSQMSCDLLPISSYIYSGSLTSSGTANNQSGFKYTDYIKIDNKSKISLVEKVSTGNSFLCFYTVNKEVISCFSQYDLSSNDILTIPNNASYFRATLNLTYNKPTWKICKNGNQAVTDTLTDSTPPDSSPIANATGWLPPGPVDSILNLPLTLMNSISNVISSGTCQPITVDLPHISNTPLVIPCMSTVWENIGLSTFFTWFGRILGGIILYRYLVRLYKWVDDTLTMRENNNFDDGSMG